MKKNTFIKKIKVKVWLKTFINPLKDFNRIIGKINNYG